MLFETALPVNVRMAGSVMPSPTSPVSGEKEVMVGTAGGWGEELVVSIVTLSTEDAALVLPAASVAVAVKLCAPFGSAAVVKVHAPLLFAVVVPIWVPPSNILIALLATAVPVSVGVLSLVMPSPTTPLSVENELIVGAAGAV